MQTILGIDPGSRITGYGVIRSNGLRNIYISSGCIRTDGYLSARLSQIFEALRQIMSNFAPSIVAVEEIFMHRNVSAALKLGHARGVAIVAAGNSELPVVEYSTREIKRAVVGYGAARKEQVQHMVKTLLNLSGIPQADAADALAVALCHAHFGLGKINREINQ